MLNMSQPLSKDTIEDVIKKISDEYDGVVAVFLFGSFAEDKWTDSCDLDVEIILESAEGIDSRPVPFLLDGHPVELHVHGRNRYENVGEVASKRLCSRVVNSIVIYDPSGFFNSVKERVSKIFYTSPYIRRRITYWLAVADRYIQNADRFSQKGEVECVLGSLHRATNSGIAMAIFNLMKVNPTQRRGLSKLEESLIGSSYKDLYWEILDLLNLRRASFEWASEAIGHGRRFHAIISQCIRRKGGSLWEKNKHWYIDMTRRYILDGSRTLLKEGKYAASIFCTMSLTNSPEVHSQVFPNLTMEERKEAKDHLRKLFQIDQITNVRDKIQEARLITNKIANIGCYF